MQTHVGCRLVSSVAGGVSGGRAETGVDIEWFFRVLEVF